MKVQLVDGWNKAYRWFSVQALGLALAFQVTWVSIPDDLRSRAPDWVALAVTLTLLVAGILGRMVEQPVKPE